MDRFRCPFCGTMNAKYMTTHSKAYLPTDKLKRDSLNRVIPDDNVFLVETFTCTCCDRTSAVASRTWGENTFFTQVYPQDTAIRFPDYIPAAIRMDYEEAHAIVKISPRAAATLCRRCLQGMIRNFWNISGRTLNDEIAELQQLIPPAQWQVIDSLRRIGNIGAHMERDVNLIIDIDRATAGKLVKLIEHLLKEWYVNRHETEMLYNDIIAADAEAQDLRRS